MSAPPPPPPPPNPLPSAARGPAWDRQALRDQRRALKMVARQQRAVQKAQLRSARRTSILGPVLLVGAGVFFLLLEVGDLPSALAFGWLARWWPLLLLASGLILLAEWAVDTRVDRTGPGAPPRRTVGPGSGFLLVLLVLLGLSADGIENGTQWIRRDFGQNLGQDWGLGQFLAQHTEADQELSATMSHGALLTVQNDFGRIEITGSSSDGQVHVSVHQRFTVWRQDDLQSAKRRYQPQLKNNGSGLLLAVPGTDRDRADLTIELPRESALDIAPEQGDLSVSEIHGPVTVREHQGNITLTGLTGQVHLVTRDDDATITGHSLSGDVSLEGRSGDLAFSDITGPLTLHGTFYGTTHLERVAGPIHFQTSFTDLSCAGLPGELNIEGRSELHGENLDGPVILSTSNRDVTLSKVRQGLSLTNRNGSVTVALADPLGAVQVDNIHGAIHLRVPEKAPFSLAATTEDGSIRNDLGLTAEQHDRQSSLRAQVHKGGPSLTLQTSRGDISIRSASQGDSADASEASSSDDEDQ